MLNYVIKRLLGLIPTLLIVAVLVFLFVHMLPGDPARLIAGPEADAQVVAMVRQQLGLDQPLHVQFWHYITNVLRGDFGISMASRRPVASEIASRFMPTPWLTLASMSWAVLFGMAAGIAAAVAPPGWMPRVCSHCTRCPMRSCMAWAPSVKSYIINSCLRRLDNG